MWDTLAANLPHLNAALNLIATILLALGLYYIKNGRAKIHKQMMLRAFGVSILFLLCYLFHKFALYQPSISDGRARCRSIHVFVDLDPTHSACHRGAVPCVASDLPGQERSHCGSQKAGPNCLSHLDVRFGHGRFGLSDALPTVRVTN